MIDLDRLSWISKICLNENEEKELEKEIQEILKNFEKIQEVDVQEEEFESISLSNQFYRNDSEPEKFDEHAIIENFPKKEGKKLEVPRLL